MRTMQRAGAVLIVLTMAVTLLSGSPKLIGTYVNTKEPETTLELKADGSFSVSVKDRVVATGDYKVDGTVITLNVKESGKQATGKIEGDVFTDPEGVTWKKR